MGVKGLRKYNISSFAYIESKELNNRNRNVPPLTIEALKTEAKLFAAQLSSESVSELYGVNDGKKVGTYVEIRLNDFLSGRYEYETGSAANGVDFPELHIDVKATSKKQPQSSSPFRDSSQKVYGLGHHLLIFVYDKKDDTSTQSTSLNIEQVIFVHKEQTGDSQTTKGLIGILERDGSKDDILAFLEERNLILHEDGMLALAERILKEPPQQGYLTISNALQWRLQFGHAIRHAKLQDAPGVENLLA